MCLNNVRQKKPNEPKGTSEGDGKNSKWLLKSIQGTHTTSTKDKNFCQKVTHTLLFFKALFAVCVHNPQNSHENEKKARITVVRNIYFLVTYDLIWLFLSPCASMLHSKTSALTEFGLILIAVYTHTHFLPIVGKTYLYTDKTKKLFTISFF